MKKQIIIFGAFIALTLAFIQAANAAQLVAPGYVAPIEKLIAGQQFKVNPDAITGGLVKIDTDHQTIEVIVTKQNEPCMGKLICPPTLNNTLQLKLPIIKIDRDNCGVISYTAAKGNTEGRQVITVRDNSNYSCRNFMALPKTSVSLVKQTRGDDASALFTAGELQELH